MSDWQHTDALTDIERLVIEYSDVLTRTPVTVSDDLSARLKAQFSAKQLSELTSYITWENARARFNRGFSIGADGYLD